MTRQGMEIGGRHGAKGILVRLLGNGETGGCKNALVGVLGGENGALASDALCQLVACAVASLEAREMTPCWEQERGGHTCEVTR